MALITCPECGKEISDKAASCPGCGCPMRGLHESGQKSSPPQIVTVRKSRGVYVILGLLLGLLGAHSFYAGFYWQGFFQLVLGAFLFWTFVGPLIVAIWIIVDLVSTTHDASGQRMA